MATEKTINSILVIKPSSLGDILHVFPALQLLREQCPDAQLDFVVNPEFAPLLDFSPFPVRHRILFERKKLASFSGAPGAFLSLVRSLRREKYDLVLDFQGLLRSSFFAWLSAHRRSSVYGFDAPREKLSRIFYARRCAVTTSHAVEKNVELAGFALSVKSSVPDPTVPIPQKYQTLLSELPESFILLMPGARWESKCFPTELFAQTAVGVFRNEKNVHFIVAGSKSEIPKSAELCTKIAPEIPVTDLTGKTSLGELFALIGKAKAVVCNDSGPMHIAALLRTPVFAFFGPTSPEKTGPWKQNDRVFRAACACAECMNKKCPLPETVCHKIDPSAVSTAISEQIYRKE